jgi:predicted RNase H-like HicB family nuclease
MEESSKAQEKFMSAFTPVLPNEDDRYGAECAEAGTASQGITVEETVSNLTGAT